MTTTSSEDAASHALDARKRRAIWRAEHRGTKELDILVGRYAAAHLSTMSAPDLDLFEEFLAVSDVELQRWILIPASVPDDKFAGLIADLKRFHGLTAV